ncbi:flavin reductase family protein [Flavobacterium lacus]|uniref:Flavin reductase (DIM6/NTAB) family NADH-FMN oxidoreductase RutF n=1 Tax=Flavobacterium lacus TaxID=1353778 RepID=A0A328X362_9FLAO|nr:flavin reductase [Flavobacterium lacus]RAR49689.1 flavin reductase (DIM6/NTAB) family NADH-FMN oxidoreductase RutF [Flavobacterium lacus]
MLHYSKNAIQNLSKVPRLNLINSCTGYKSANLIATKTSNGISNVAVFSSITHLGSDPAMLGFILRPTTVPRNTYKNIRDLGYFTVNHITESMIIDAHHTSANYDESISEFNQTNLEEEFYEGIETPFVKGSPVQILCKYLNEYEIKENGTIHIIASIEELFVKENLIQKENWLRLDLENVVSINGLDAYCVPTVVDRFEYARPNIPTKSML